MKYIITVFFLLSTLFTSLAQQKMQVFFNFNSFILHSEAKEKLGQLIQNNSKVKIVKLVGYSDSKGSNIYNDVLALKRIQTVLNYLNENSI